MNWKQILIFDMKAFSSLFRFCLHVGRRSAFNEERFITPIYRLFCKKCQLQKKAKRLTFEGSSCSDDIFRIKCVILHHRQGVNFIKLKIRMQCYFYAIPYFWAFLRWKNNENTTLRVKWFITNFLLYEIDPREWSRWAIGVNIVDEMSSFLANLFSFIHLASVFNDGS